MSLTDIIYEERSKLEENKKEILISTKKVLTELKLNNVHEYFCAYCYLLWNGYFSNTKYQEYTDINIETELDNSIDDEFTIFRGKGVCRHFAIFLNEVLNELKIDSKKLSIRLNNHDIKTLMDIKRNIGEHEDHTIYDNGKENHAVVLTKDNIGLYIMDPTILCEHEVIQNNKLISFCGPYNINQEIFNKNLNRFLDKNYQHSKECTISKEKLIQYYIEAKSKCIENKKLFEDYYKEMKPKYEKNEKILELFLK